MQIQKQKEKYNNEKQKLQKQKKIVHTPRTREQQTHMRAQKQQTKKQLLYNTSHTTPHHPINTFLRMKTKEKAKAKIEPKPKPKRKPKVSECD